jgi:hypothetical protein
VQKEKGETERDNTSNPPDWQQPYLNNSIGNDDGHLILSCEEFMDSSRRVSISIEGLVTAECEDRNGRWRNSTLDFERYYQWKVLDWLNEKIGKSDGRLVTTDNGFLETTKHVTVN